MSHPPADLGSLAARLRWLRARTGLTQRGLDWLAGRSYGHTSLIEKAPAGAIRTDTLVDMAGVFGVSLDWLVLGVGPTPSHARLRRAVEAARARRDEAAA